MTTIIDYGMGNLQSLANALQFLGEKVKIATEPKEIARAKKLIFPGVGNFGKAIENLKKRKIGPSLRNSINKGTPFLGICLGLQLLFEESQEAPQVKGLSVFKGKIIRFQKVKIPQIGWNQLEIKKKPIILKGIPDKSFVYFMHSFYAEPEDKKILAAITNYGKDFCSAVESKNIFGVQFHPEKSGKTGLRILENFIKLKC